MRLIFFALLFLGLPAKAEEWGLSLGVAQSSAKTRVANTSIVNRTSFRAGLLSSFFLLDDNVKIRTGLLYTQRRFELHEDEFSYTYDWDFIDVPALLQIQYSKTVGFFGGVVLAINVGDKVTPSLESQGTRKINTIYQAGANFLFDNMYGFDIYYEQGFDNLDDNTAQPSTFGVNLVYYFL